MQKTVGKKTIMAKKGLKPDRSRPSVIIKNVRVKKQSVSPSPGVPPPNDLKSNSLDEASDVSFDQDLMEIKNTTDALAKELQSKISDYKNTNKAHLEKTKELFYEKESCQSELGVMKESLGEILKEARHTKEELKEMREKLDEEAFRDFEYSNVRVPPDPIFSQLIELKREIDYMNNRLSFTECELQLKTVENSELRSVVTKLKDSIIEQNVIDEKPVDISCKACVVF